MRGCEVTRWTVAPRDPVAEQELALATGLPPLLAAILRNRGLGTPAAVAGFLRPSAEGLHDPWLLPDMEPAVARLQRAVENRERVLVHGDYDADGLTSVALLAQVLGKLGCEVQYYIPHRVHEQYGISLAALDGAARLGVRLLVAADCGVAEHEAIAHARSLGMDVIVVDHHEPSGELPSGAWVIDPKREDSRYPERDLAAVGLAFKLASALCRRQQVSELSLQRRFLDLVAIGTIADVVPLRGENRILTALGLQVLSQTRSAGLRALLEVCSLTGPVRATEVAFRLAPRLNAVGRVGDGADGLDLLLTDDPQEARRLALHLDNMNRQRQREQESAYAEALRLVNEEVDLQEDRVIVLSSPTWHVGVVGIVASRLQEQYHRPAVMLVHEGERLRGSARSIHGFDITAALGECSGHLLRFGGHAFAAGLTLQPGDLEEFRRRLNLVATETLAPEDLVCEVTLDACVRLSEVDETLVADLAQLEPFGHGNPEPLLLTEDVEVVEHRTVGADNRHLKLYVTQGNRTVECIGFGLGSEASWIKPCDRLDLCYTPELNDYQGLQSLQLRLEALRPHVPGRVNLT